MKETMASEWQHFRLLDVAANAPEVQVREMRKAFYAGLASGVKLAALRSPRELLRDMSEYIAAEDRRRKGAP
jgi:hypothetical protein